MIFLSRIRNQDGYFLMVVTIIGIILAIIFGAILPQLHTGQQVRAMTNLNEIRAYEAAKKGLSAVMLGVEDVDNFQELIGYAITGADSGSDKFTISGNYAYLFSQDETFKVYYSPGNDTDDIEVYKVLNASDVGNNTEITVNTVTGKDVQISAAGGVICRNRGILWAITQLCGATTTSTRHDEYTDVDGNVLFVSGCQGIDLSGNDDGKLQIIVMVSRNGIVNEAPNGDRNDDGWYFYNDGKDAEGNPISNGNPWLSVDNWGATPIGNFRYDGLSPLYYYDIDMKETIDGNNYKTNTDFKYQRTGGQWYFSIGNNGTWRGQYSGTELWNIMKDFSEGDAAFQGKDNDGDGNTDNVEAFIIARSTGITVAPGLTYTSGPDKKDVRLVHEANSHLPNPMPQVLESGFYVAVEQ